MEFQRAIPPKAFLPLVLLFSIKFLYDLTAIISILMVVLAIMLLTRTGRTSVLNPFRQKKQLIQNLLYAR